MRPVARKMLADDCVERITADEAITELRRQAVWIDPGEAEYRAAVEAVRDLIANHPGGYISSDEAATAIEAAVGESRTIVHCWADGTDLDVALTVAGGTVQTASEIAWCHPPYMGDHQLAVAAGPHVYHFKVMKQPAGETGD